MGYFPRKYVILLFLIGKISAMLPLDEFNSHVAHFKLTFQLCFGRTGGNGHVTDSRQVGWVDGQNWNSESKIKGFDCGRWDVGGHSRHSARCCGHTPLRLDNQAEGSQIAKEFDFARPPATCTWEKPQGHSWLNSCLCTTSLTWLRVLCLPTPLSICVCKAQSQLPNGVSQGRKNNTDIIPEPEGLGIHPPRKWLSYIDLSIPQPRAPLRKTLQDSPHQTPGHEGTFKNILDGNKLGLPTRLSRKVIHMVSPQLMRPSWNTSACKDSRSF